MAHVFLAEVGPAVRDRGRSRQILAMTGSMPHLCNEIGWGTQWTVVVHRGDPKDGGKVDLGSPYMEKSMKVVFCRVFFCLGMMNVVVICWMFGDGWDQKR